MTPTTRDKLAARLEKSRDIIAALKFASSKIGGFDREELQALTERLTICSSPENHFIATDALNETTGELYEANGTLWNCGSKLCPSCLSKQAARNRRKLRNALDRQTLDRGERYYFVTFTIPNPRLPILRTRDLVNRAWTLFRKRKLCVSLVKGGCKSEEFTLTANGYHYHLHGIFLSKFLLYNEVRRTWTECVETAFAEANQPFTVNTKDGLLLVKLQPVKDRERAIQEVCKYITKSDSWQKMRVGDLVDLALIRRWARMFELFGSFANRGTREAILDTTDLSDGEASPENVYWRDFVQDFGLPAYKERLSEEVAKVWANRRRQIVRRWPYCTLTLLSDYG